MMRIAALADQCVRCGLCLPHCPSYRVRPEEGESPRGRIALARALAASQAAPTPIMRTHLAHCLACGTCEAVCPSGVKFDEMLSATRAVTGAASDPLSARWLRVLLRHPRVLRIAVWLARALESTLASRIWRRLPRALRILVESAAIAPRASAPVSFTPAAGQRRGALALFRGCAAAVFDADTHHSAAEVLSQLGFDVYAPRESQCCGALARHAGAADEAERIAHATGESLGTLPAETVIGTASGCQRDLEQRVLGAAELSARSLFGFLAADSSFATKAWRIRPRHAAVLTPCTERPEEMKALAQVLERIAGLKLSWLTLQPRCCGAAGSYFVEQPDLAEALRAERVAEIKALAPDLLLTTNVGCRMYLAAGLRQAGMVIPVHHPVALLAEALEQTQ